MKFRNALMLINMVLFMILGITILVRAPGRTVSPLAYLMGCGFLFAGGYRLYLLIFRRKGHLV